jgi:1-acyl-sn-glycerol-3-phosphate acyltransferase
MDIFKSLIVWIIGLCYMVLLFPLTFIIWLLVLPFDKERVVIHWMLIYQGVILTRMIPIWKIDIEGTEKFVSGTTYIFISNHQSILDILFLNTLRYKYKWISKIENVKVPVLGWYVKMAGYITVNRGDEESKAEMLERAYRCLKSGMSIMIFPEGTRSHDKEIGFFKRGAFQLAMQAEVPILPIIIDGTGNILPKHGLLFNSGLRIKIKILDPVLPESFGNISPEELALKLNSIMKSELKQSRDISLTR